MNNTLFVYNDLDNVKFLGGLSTMETSRSRRNYWALTLEGSFFVGGIALLSTGGTIALFLDSMTGSIALVGLAATIQTLFMFLGQLSSAPFVRTIKALPRFLFRHMIGQRIIPFLMAVPLLFGLVGNLSVLIFFILFAIFWFYDGILTVPWGELSARALESDRRSHMMGMQVTIGGIMSLVTGLLLTWLLATPLLTDHYRFAVIFILAAVILLPSVLCIRMVQDPNPIAKEEKSEILKYYARIPSIIRGSKLLQHALLARLPAFIGFSSITFLVVFGVNTLELSSAQVSWLVYANIAGALVGGITLGEISKRFGNKTNIIVCNSCVILTLCMAVTLIFVPQLGYAWLFVTCSLGSLTLSSWIGYFNYYLDIAPKDERTAFQVIGSCIGIPFSFVGFAMGAVIDNLGFITAFIIGGVFALTALMLSIRLKSKAYIKDLHDSSET